MSVRNLPMRRDTIVKGDNRVNVSIIATHAFQQETYTNLSRSIQLEIHVYIV